MNDAVYLRDLDGTGSMHVCSKEDPGAIEYIPTPTHADEWRPIETAPKDGTWVLGWQKREATEDQIETWQWRGGPEGFWVNAIDHNDFDEKPTHWRPLPQPPKEKADD